MFGPLLEIFVCVSVHKVLDGSESQYSGMQIGTLQDEEDEAAAAAASSSQEEPPEPPFLQSALGASVYTNTLGSCYRSRSAANRSSASIVPLVPAPVLFTALSKPHLFEGRGHNRQGSDSSVERFIPKEEPAEPEPDNKVSFSHWIFLLGLIKFPESKIEVKGDVNGRCIWLSNFFSAPQPSRIKGPIGHYTDQGVEPLVHCVRLLAASFLLTGQKNGERLSDLELKINLS